MNFSSVLKDRRKHSPEGVLNEDLIPLFFGLVCVYDCVSIYKGYFPRVKYPLV